MDELEDTERLPALRRASPDLKSSGSQVETGRSSLLLLVVEREKEGDVLDSLSVDEAVLAITEDEIDTLRLPALKRSRGEQKTSTDQDKEREQDESKEQANGSGPRRDEFQDKDSGPSEEQNQDVENEKEEEDFVFETIPVGNVSLPVPDDEIDTLRLRAVKLSADIQKTSTAWINGDGRRVILARALRMFGYGFISVLLGATLATSGFTLVYVSLLLTTALIGDMVAISFVAMFADRLGRRRMLVLFALLMALAGLAFLFSRNLLILLVASFFGTISPSGTSENTPFIAIEQAILPQTCGAKRRTDAFARYNLMAQLAGAIGGLAVTLPDLLHHLVGLATLTSIHAMFGVYALLGVSSAILFMGMTKKVELPLEADGSPKTTRNMSLKQSRSVVLRLASLFVVDAFAGGLVVQTILAFWFQQRFHISLSILGVLFFGANLLAALSLPVAARLSKRFGLLKTMVFTHLPSQVFLLLVPLMPTFWLAAFFLLCRQALSKMDVPTRQAYITELVVPEERTAAAGFTTMARSVATSMSPLVAGMLLTGSVLVLGLPFLMAGGLSMLYDLLLYRTFRNVPISKE